MSINGPKKSLQKLSGRCARDSGPIVVGTQANGECCSDSNPIAMNHWMPAWRIEDKTLLKTLVTAELQRLETMSAELRRKADAIPLVNKGLPEQRAMVESLREQRQVLDGSHSLTARLSSMGLFCKRCFTWLAHVTVASPGPAVLIMAEGCASHGRNGLSGQISELDLKQAQRAASPQKVNQGHQDGQEAPLGRRRSNTERTEQLFTCGRTKKDLASARLQRRRAGEQSVQA